MVCGVLVGVALRLYRLGAYGLWRDEAEAVFTAAAGFPLGITRVLAGDVHAPLYFLLLHFWEGLLGRSEFAVRLLSALCGVAILPLMYVAGRRLFDRRVGLIAAWIAAILPLHVICSRTTRMYSLLPLMGLLALIALHRAMTARSRVAWVAYALLGAATIYTHYWGALWVAALSVAALAQMALERRPKSEWLALAAAEAGMAGLFAPWLPTFWRQLQIQESVMGPWLRQQSTVANVLRFFNELTALAWPRGLPFLWMGLLALGTFVYAFRLEDSGRTPVFEVGYPLALGRNLVVIGLFVPMGLGAVISARSQGLAPSYVTMAVFPALCLLLALGIASLRRPLLVGVLLAGLSLLWLRTDLGFYRGPISVMREVAGRVARDAVAEDVVIVAPDYLAPAFSYYFRGPAAQAAFPGLHRRVEAMDWVHWSERRRRAGQAVPEMLAFVEAELGPAGRVWLVAPIEGYPNDPFFDRIRELEGELDRRFMAESQLTDWRGVVETADVFVYRRR